MKRQTILITGGSSGIGFEMAKQLARTGNTVIICGRSEEKLDIAKRQQKELITIKCDITDREDRKKLYKKITSQFNELSMLINNAAIVNRFSIHKTDKLEEIINDEWRTNYLAPVLITQNFLDLLSANKGMAVNINSCLAHVPLFIEPDYCAMKAALHSMSLSMRIQFSRLGIRIVEIFYPSVDTPFQQGHAPKNAIKPDIAARIAIQGIKKGRNEIHVKTAGIIYELSRFIPKTILKVLNGSVSANYEKILYDNQYA